MAATKKRTAKPRQKTATKSRTGKSLTGSFRLKPGVLAIIAGVLILIGGLWIVLARAAGNEKVSLEAEQANTKIGTAPLTDSAASGGSAVQLTSAGTGIGGWPAPDSYKVCGNQAVLAGPTSAPAGAVVINPGTDLATATANAAAGTTFYLTAGTHTLPTAPINPKTGNTYIGAPGAVLDGQFKTNYTSGSRVMSMAFKGSIGYSNVTIKYLTIKNFGQADGKMSSMINQTAINWGQSPGWTVSNNTIANNGGAGLWAASNSKITTNCIENNEQLGFAVPSKGGTDYTQHTNILLEGNEIRGNNRSNAIESVGVCTGCAGGLKIWNSKGVTIRNNNVNTNNGTGIWVDNNNIDVLVEGNISKDNTKRGIFYEISYGGIIRKNYVTGSYVGLKGSANNAAIYISESGGDEATKTLLGGTFPAELDINNNYIVDNWQGITLWEDAGRYCSQNDTSWCPPLIQGTNETQKSANLAKCTTNLASNADVCRWKTKNVKVRNNQFEMTSASTWCASSNTSCGLNSIIANSGPAGTPYAGSAIQEAITKNQNNIFSGNKYVGPAKFNVYSGGNSVTQAVWQSTWKQDVDSSFSTSGTQNCTATNAGASEIGYSSIQLQGGSYKVWARIKTSNGGRVRMIVNNSKCSDIASLTGVSDWQWSVSNQTISSLLSGAYSIRIVALDPGVSIDNLIILDAADICAPSGLGTNCSATSTPTTTITPTTTTTVTPPADTTAPVGPASLSAATASTTQINLSWPAATDNVGVTQYVVTRNGAQVYASTNLSFSDTGLIASTTYQYKVVARDAAGNTSAGANASATTQATPTTTTTVTPAPTTTITPPPPPTDTTKPTAPTNVKGTINWDAFRFAYYTNLTWGASGDNVGVTSYEVKRNGASLGSTAKTSFQDYNIVANTSYSYDVYAKDAAGNVSLPGNARLVGRCFLIWCWAE